jgi:hypothetical protein
MKNEIEELIQNVKERMDKAGKGGKFPIKGDNTFFVMAGDFLKILSIIKSQQEQIDKLSVQNYSRKE